jgi:hypothetical protein
MAMALHVAADGAVTDVEVCERGGAVTFVVVRHRPGTARLDRQTGLGGRAPGFLFSSTERTTAWAGGST